MTRAVRELAESLAAFHADSDSAGERIYWFPSEEAVRLIDIVPTAMPHDPGALHPYFFGARPKDGITLPSALVVITPEDVATATPPDGWGSWADAVLIWPREERLRPSA